MDVRILKPGDEALLRASAAAADDDDVDLARCSVLLADPNFIAAVAVENGEALGLAYGHVLRQLTGDGLILYSMDVAEPARRRGAARAMIEALKAYCRDHGLFEMWVPTNSGNAPAMALYTACGGIREDDDEAIFVFETA